MIKAVSGTVASRILVTFFNFLTISVAGNTLGNDGLGIISLILLAITVVMLFNNLIGGPSIVYLVPRIGARSVLIPAYAWALITALVFYGVIHQVNLVPERFSFHILFLAFIQSLYTIHYNIIIGREYIRPFNIISAIHALIVLLVFSYMVLVEGVIDPIGYVWALYAAFGFSLLATSIVLPGKLGKEKVLAPLQAFARIVRYGIFTQLANTAQLLNTRVSYYIINPILGLGELGIFSVSTQLSEGSLVTPKSMAVILYMRISNSNDKDENRKLTISFVKVGVVIATAIMGVLILMPSEIYRVLFGPEMVGVRKILLILFPGVVAMSASSMFSHYFTGIGKHHQNSIGSGIGLVVTLAAGLTLIPAMGLVGAGITASLSYCTLTLYKAIVFTKDSGAKWLEFLPNKNDVKILTSEWRKYRSRGQVEE